MFPRKGTRRENSLNTVEQLVKLNYLLTAKDSALLKEGLKHIANFDSFAAVKIVYYRINFNTEKVVFLIRDGKRASGQI
ncbi:unnamed protein product [Peronospora effusa]|nr:unnamed protein product [Peronospora effusa]